MEKEDIVSIPKEINPSRRKKVLFANNYTPKANLIKTLRKIKINVDQRGESRRLVAIIVAHGYNFMEKMAVDKGQEG